MWYKIKDDLSNLVKNGAYEEEEDTWEEAACRAPDIEFLECLIVQELKMCSNNPQRAPNWLQTWADLARCIHNE